MSKKNDFRTELENYWKTLIKAKHSFEIYLYLKKYSNDELSPLWRHVKNISFKDTIIELDKIIGSSKQQKFRINHLLGKLKKDSEYRSLNYSEENLQKVKTTLAGFDEVINEINKLRDEQFAHLDFKKDVMVNNIDRYPILIQVLEKTLQD